MLAFSLSNGTPPFKAAIPSQIYGPDIACPSTGCKVQGQSFVLPDKKRVQTQAVLHPILIAQTLKD
jgi:hypothetical protein